MNLSATTLSETIYNWMSWKVYTIDDVDVTVARLLVAVIAFLAVFVFSRLIQRAIRRALTAKDIINEQTMKTTCTFSHYTIMAIGVVITLKIAGIDLSTIFTAGAVLTVGLGFAMQNIVQNFMSGVILFLERSIQAGDILEVNGEVVRVLRIRVRTTLALTRRRQEMIIPNSNIAQGIVINYTMTDATFLLSTTVGVSYSSDMNKVKDVLEKTARGMDWRVPEGDVVVLMSQFGSSSVDFKVLIEVDDPWLARRFISHLNEAVWWALKENDITIAFPQLDVHFDTP